MGDRRRTCHLPPMDHHHHLAATHLLQQTLRALCSTPPSRWLYAVFWRILPRNYPPPKWDFPGSIYDRSRGNRRNWILAWEDGFCNFAAASGGEISSSSSSSDDPNGIKGLQPDLFFKMSHEIYSFGEGLLGKVAADHGHKWVFKDPPAQDVNSPWNNPCDLHPRTWEAQFQSGIQTIALIAVREGVVQLGSLTKVEEDLNYVVMLRKKFSYLESIPGVLLPHPSIAMAASASAVENWTCHPPLPPPQAPDHFWQLSQQVRIVPSMSSLEVLLSKLPSVGGMPSPSGSSSGFHVVPPVEVVTVAPDKEEMCEEEAFREGRIGVGGELSLDVENCSPYYGNYVSKPN